MSSVLSDNFITRVKHSPVGDEKPVLQIVGYRPGKEWNFMDVSDGLNELKDCKLKTGTLNYTTKELEFSTIRVDKFFTLGKGEKISLVIVQATMMVPATENKSTKIITLTKMPKGQKPTDAKYNTISSLSVNGSMSKPLTCSVISVRGPLPCKGTTGQKYTKIQLLDGTGIINGVAKRDMADDILRKLFVGKIYTFMDYVIEHSDPKYKQQATTSLSIHIKESTIILETGIDKIAEKSRVRTIHEIMESPNGTQRINVYGFVESVSNLVYDKLREVRIRDMSTERVLTVKFWNEQANAISADDLELKIVFFVNFGKDNYKGEAFIVGSEYACHGVASQNLNMNKWVYDTFGIESDNMPKEHDIKEPEEPVMEDQPTININNKSVEMSPMMTASQHTESPAGKTAHAPRVAESAQSSGSTNYAREREPDERRSRQGTPPKKRPQDDTHSSMTKKSNK